MLMELPVTAALPEPVKSPRIVPVMFTGKGGEYFRLWIVNILLTMVTFGFYSPWAKVRNARYLHGHTHVDGHAFSYLATPMQLLKGRLKFLGIVLLLVIVASLLPNGLKPLLGVLFLVALPWLIQQSIRFSLRMTAYRNVCFSFEGRYVGVLVHFLVLPMVGVLTLFLAFPWVTRRLHQYLYENIRFGGKPFTLELKTSYYYFVALCCVGVLLGLMAFTMIVGGLLGSTIMGAAWAGVAAMGSLAAMVSGYLIGAVFMAMTRNHVLSTLRIDQVVAFQSRVTIRGYIVLSLTNVLLLVVTLGLAWPLTIIRSARYLAEHTSVVLYPGVDDLVNTVSGRDSALGEEAADLLDVDGGFALVN
jgi:uncharacterized membrane protein YjgN (DUF898 family)